MLMLFADRRDAGQQLARLLQHYQRQSHTIVLGLPRGGMIVAAEVARALHLPLDIVVTRKIGAPFNKEFAIGAVTPDGTIHLNAEAEHTYHLDQAYITQEAHNQQQEAQRRLHVYRGSRPPLNLKDRTIILVDDGVATGLTMETAIAMVRQQQAKKIVLAAPVGAPDSVARLRSHVDEAIIPHLPEGFSAVGQWYEEFSEVGDQAVIAIMHQDA